MPVEINENDDTLIELDDEDEPIQEDGEDIDKAKRQQTATRAAEAMRQLLEGPDPASLPAISWNRLGLSLASSEELHQLREDMMAPLEFAKESHHHETSIVGSHEGPHNHVKHESSYDKRMNAYKHDTLLRQHVNTFVSYKWMLQALLRRTSSAKGGCQVLIADVILFSEGDPLTWIYTNKHGCIDSRTFVATGNDLLWARFLKTAWRASGVSKDDLVTPICVQFASSVEGVRGNLMGMTELLEFIKRDPANRHHVVGLQVIIGPKCGYRKRPSRKSIVYKTEYKRESPLGHTFKHTKEYDVQTLGEQSGDVDDLTTKFSAAVTAPNASPVLDPQLPFDSFLGASTHGLRQSHRKQSFGNLLISVGEEDVQAEQFDVLPETGKASWIPPWRAKRQVVHSQSLNRPLLSSLTLQCVKYVEKSRGIVLQTMCGHFVEDSSNRVWMTGVSNLLPYEESGKKQENCEDDSSLQDDNEIVPEVGRTAARLTDSIRRLQDTAEAVLEAIKVPAMQRKEPAHQIIFAELRGNHFLDQLLTGWQYEIAKTAEYKFVECGLEVYYSGDLLDEMYVIVQGSVRLILEPNNTTYCRTVDLSDKDTFAEQAITRPGTKITSQAVALEDTHLMVIKRKAFEAVINKGKKLNNSRWHVTKRQIDKCRRIFSFEPAARNILDLKQSMESTVNCDFFQNMSPFLHMDLCAHASFRTVEPGKTLFQDLESPPAYFAVVLRGRLRWRYTDERSGEKEVDVRDSQYLLSVGTATNASIQNVEAIVISRQHWERATSQTVDDSDDGDKKAVQYSKEPPKTSFFLTELDETVFIQPPARDRSNSTSAGGGSLQGGKGQGGDKESFGRVASAASQSFGRVASAVSQSFGRVASAASEGNFSRTQSAVPGEDLFDKKALKDSWGRGLPFVKMSKEEQLAAQSERHVTCAVTGIRFPAVLQRSIQRRQVMETAKHLQQRRAHSTGYDRQKWLIEPKSRLALFDMVTVCPGAYAAFVMEKNLVDQEKIFAKSLTNKSVPMLSQRTLPPSGSESMTTQLLLSGMFIELVKLESPAALLDFGSEFDIRFRLCEQNVSMQFEVQENDIPAGGAPLKIDQVRMSWFFSSDEGVNVYMRKQSVMEFTIFNCKTGVLFATAKADLSELANKVALQQSFRLEIEPAHKDLASMLALQFAYLHINMGCIKFREVEAKSFHLRRRQGLYIPSTPFITECLPPDGWDPCNDEYIRELMQGTRQNEIDATALTLDGALIPRSSKIQYLLEADAQHRMGKDSSLSNPESRMSRRKYERLSDGIAPAPIWQRKKYGELPPKYPGSGTIRSASAPIDTMNSPSRVKSRSRAESASRSRLLSPAASSPARQRRPSSSPAKRTAHEFPSRPSSALSNTGKSSRRTPPPFRAKRPESAPPRAENVHDSRRTFGPGTRKLAANHGDIAKRTTGNLMQRPTSAKMPDRRPSSALASSRQRPNSAFGKMAYSDGQRSRSPSNRPLMMQRPNSAMSNLAPSSADECDFIDTIDELDQTEWAHRRAISPFEFRDLLDPESSNVDFLKTSSSNSVLSGNFGIGPTRRRPASAMATATCKEEETEEVNAHVLAAITRPRSAAASKTAKCVMGLRNQVPSFQSAFAVSRLAELAGKRAVRGTDILATVESTHQAWRANITEISMLDHDLKALDARSRIVAFRERATAQV